MPDPITITLSREEAEVVCADAEQHARELWRSGHRSPKRTYGGHLRLLYKGIGAKLRAALAEKEEDRG